MRIRLTDRVVDFDRRTIDKDDQASERLTRLEEGLLRYLVAHRGRVVPQQELLEQVWGYRAGVRSDAVKLTVFRLRRKLEGDPKHPRHIHAAPGKGYRFEAGDGWEPERAERSTELDLPLPRTSFHGRARALAELRASVERAALTVVVGPGGIGKTRTSLELVRALFAEGTLEACCFCDLSGTDDTRGVQSKVAQSLGVSADGLLVPTNIAGLFDRPRALVVLDNAEHVIEPLRELLELWLRNAPGARFLITSRQRTGISGEALVELGPLERDAAVALFRDRARALGRAEGDAGDVEKIVEAVDAIPLAVELAAGRTVALTLSDILRRLADPFPVLRGTGADGSSLWGTIDRSWQLLLPAEQRLWAACGAFAGSFDLPAAEHVLAPEVSGSWVGDLLQSLCDKHLLETVELGGRLRFVMLRPMWHYAHQRLLELADADAIRDRHASWYAQLDVSIFADVDRLEEDRENLFVAFRWSRDKDVERASALCLVLQRVIHRRGPASLGLALAEESLAWEGLSESVRSRLLNALSHMKNMTGDVRGALAAAEAAAGIAAILDERVNAWVDGCLFAYQAGDLDEARRLANAAGEVVDRCPAWLQGRVHHALGLAAVRDDPGAAEAHLQRALLLHREVDAIVPQASTLTTLGLLLTMRGDLAGAETRHREAAAIFLQVGDVARTAQALTNVGFMQIRRGALSEAGETLDEAIRWAQRVGGRSTEASARANLAWRAVLLGDVEESDRMNASALGLLRAPGHENARTRILIFAAWHAIHTERWAMAEAYVAEIRAIIEPTWRRDVLFLEALQGHLAARRGALADARAFLERARAGGSAPDATRPELSLETVVRALEDRLASGGAGTEAEAKPRRRR